MTATSFFATPDGIALDEIAALTGATLTGAALTGAVRQGGGAATRLRRARALAAAGPHDLAFFENIRYRAELQSTRAGACFIAEKHAALLPPGVAGLIVPHPYRAFVAIAQRLYPASAAPLPVWDADGVSPAAHVHPTARLEDNVTVEPGAVLGPDCEIGEGSRIGPTAVIGAGVRIGRGCHIGAAVSLSHALIGDHVIIHPGCRIGQDGFAYVSDRSGHTKVPQIGRVIIQDRVEIGAQTTIDRGGLVDTVIGEGTKIDNLVQIAHNCQIGRHCLIVSQCGISGSVTIGDFAILAGSVGIADHVNIGAGARIGAGSGVHADVPAGKTMLGYPALPGREFLRAIAYARKASRPASGATRETPSEE